MGLGIALAGLSGAGQAVGEELQAQDRFDQQQQLMQQKNDLETQKAMQLAQYGADLADKQRIAANARIGAASQPYLDQATLANAMADPDFAQDVAGKPDIGSLSSDQLSKYAPTQQQRTEAWLQGARDSGDLPLTGLLQSDLAAKSQKAAADLQASQISSAEAIANANRNAATKNMQANIGAAHNGQAFQLALSTMQSQDHDAQATKAAFYQTYQNFMGVAPTLANGDANPKYAGLLKQMHDYASSYNSAIGQINALRNKLGQQYGFSTDAMPTYQPLGDRVFNGTNELVMLDGSSPMPAAGQSAPAPADPAQSSTSQALGNIAAPHRQVGWN